MKKKLLFLLVAILVGMSASVDAQEKKVKPVDPVGKWDFKAADAPYGYEKGQFVITKGENAPKVKIVFNEYSKTDAYKVKYSENKMTFTVYVEDESVYISGNFEGDSFKGKASTSMGDIAITAARKKEEKK